LTSPVAVGEKITGNSMLCRVNLDWATQRSPTEKRDPFIETAEMSAFRPNVGEFEHENVAVLPTWDVAEIVGIGPPL